MLSIPDNIRDGSWQSPEKVNTWCDISSGTLQKMYQDPLPLTLAWPLQILRGHPALKTELESHYQSISDLTQSSMKLSEMTPSHNSGDYLPNPDIFCKKAYLDSFCHHLNYIVVDQGVVAITKASGLTSPTYDAIIWIKTWCHLQPPLSNQIHYLIILVGDLSGVQPTASCTADRRSNTWANQVVATMHCTTCSLRVVQLSRVILQTI